MIKRKNIIFVANL